VKGIICRIVDPQFAQVTGHRRQSWRRHIDTRKFEPKYGALPQSTRLDAGSIFPQFSEGSHHRLFINQ
jgi:hypothetical protein